MASRSHVDVNERRLRPIYDCLDNGNNKKAIQEADKALKKQKDFTCAKVLKALALLRMGRHAEGSSILSAIHKSEPTEEQTLSAMAICYKETQQYPLIASLYEAAAKHQPNNEDILSCLFMAHVRLGNYQQQQRTAMALHKLRPNKNPYYFWAVMSIVMQAHTDPKLGRTMYLPLAEKMTQKYIKEDKIEAEAEILLYLIILELEEKWEEALTILEGSMGEQLCNELNIRESRLANVCTKLERWDRVNSIYKQLLDHNPDDWACWLQYLNSSLHLIDQAYTNSSTELEPKPDASLEAIKSYIEEKMQQAGTSNRGPYLAQLQFVRKLRERGSDMAETVGSALKLLQEYFGLFGHKFCCYGDMTLFTDLLTSEETDQLMAHIKTVVGLDDSKDGYAQDLNQMCRHMVYLQLSRALGRHGSLSLEEILALSQQLLLSYREGLKFGKELLSTDLQYSDNYLLMAAHLLLDAWTRTGDDIHLWRCIVHLELGIRDSPANFQFKLLLIRLYCIKGVFGPCPALYDAMEIKHIVNDTMGYIVSNHVVRLGHFLEAGTMYTTMVRFFLVNQKEASEHLMASYKFGSFGRIQEFVEFQDRLDNSLQYRSANTEKMLLDLIIQTDRHDTAEAAAECINPHPNTKDTIDLDKIRDNRDLKIASCWDPPSEVQADVQREKSLAEEKAWLMLRYIQLQLLLAAMATGRDISGSTGINGNNPDSHMRGDVENAKEEEPLEVMKARMKQLEDYATKCAEFVEPRTYHKIQGPHRTRISTFLAGPHLKLLSLMVACIEYVHELQKQEDSPDKKSVCWGKVQEQAKELMVKDVEGLLKDVNGKRQLDSSALEQLVASVESMSYLTLLLGVCNRGLKPLKVAWNKKTKKGKGPTVSQPQAVTDFNATITALSAITKDLHQLASGLDPVFSSIDIASLRLADIPEEQELQREAERLVWNKVERSVQQSSREICEVLHHKQFYLNTLML